MPNELSMDARNDEMERYAYNAAFQELGLRWFWDSATHDELRARTADAAERLHHYLESRQAHLLKAYDAAFLVQAILDAQARHRLNNAAARAARCRLFDWADPLGGELGA